MGIRIKPFGPSSPTKQTRRRVEYGVEKNKSVWLLFYREYCTEVLISKGARRQLNAKVTDKQRY